LTPPVSVGDRYRHSDWEFSSELSVPKARATSIRATRSLSATRRVSASWVNTSSTVASTSLPSIRRWRILLIAARGCDSRAIATSVSGRARMV
jgi:hypothetical protein